MNDILKNHDTSVSEEEFNQSYLPEILSIFNKAFLEYIDLLQKTFKIKIPANRSNLFDDEDYLPLITVLENEIGINHIFEEYHNPLEKINNLIDTQIYRKEFDDLKEYLNKFNIAYNEITAIVKAQEQEGDRKKESKINYIFLIVNHEFLSFLSHYATGLVYFDSPKVFTNNLHRALSHLKRALMDIYDGMIMEQGYNQDVKYMCLRNQKISSLGQEHRMKDLIEGLEKFYHEKRQPEPSV